MGKGFILSLKSSGFNIFASGDSGECQDHLTISDGDGTPLMEKTCGSLIPQTIIDHGFITSTSNMVQLRFISDHVNTRQGWSISWSAVIPGDIVKTQVLNVVRGGFTKQNRRGSYI